MKLNNKWGYGQLFGFSALEGTNRYYDDNILMSMSKKLEFRFEYRPHWIKLSFPSKSRISIKYFMSDFLVASNQEGKILLTFLDNDTLVGVSPVIPVIKGEKKIDKTMARNVEVYSLNHHHLGMIYEKREDGLYEFIIHHSFALTEARAGCNHAYKTYNIEELIEKRIAYYKALPKCKDKKYEQLYYKALSVNKVNTYSPCGTILSNWTTPDRVPHRHMWMWDSAFHAMAFSTYNLPFAEEIFLAMLKQTKENGFMPHMANATDCSDVTQPCVMSYAALWIYKRNGNIEFLKQCLPYLDKYLTFDMNNRDKNNNGLLEWLTEPDYEICKCGESGLDNSPRFDFDEEMDCIDFSSYFALDTKCLSEIYQILGDEVNAKKWLDISNHTSNQINKLMWDEEDGVYYDRLFTSKLTKVLTQSSFLPMFANICSKEQAERMVKVLFDENLLNTPASFASISKQDPRFSTDMWRGGVWVNLNYFIIEALKNYGYNDLADEVRNKTLDMISKWYKETGCIFEFFDPNNEISPFYLERKGKPLKKPDYRKHVHSISEFNWSACFAILLIQGDY